jgi:hypothetical protein
VTKGTSSPSAGTTISEPVEDETGPQPTDPPYGSILGSTTWDVRLSDGSRTLLKIEGGSGRVSFTSQRNGGEARFYRNETTKVYDAVMTGIKEIYSDRCTVAPMGASSPSMSMTMSGTITSRGKRAKTF